MNRISRTACLLCAVFALAITGALFQAVTSLARPIGADRAARAEVLLPMVAGIAAPTVVLQGRAL